MIHILLTHTKAHHARLDIITAAAVDLALVFTCLQYKCFGNTVGKG